MRLVSGTGHQSNKLFDLSPAVEADERRPIQSVRKTSNPFT